MNKIEKPTQLINDVGDSTLNQNTEKKLGFISSMIAVFAVALVSADIFLMMNANGYIDGQKRCIVIQEIKGKDYKVNTCTGELQELGIRELAYKD